MLNTYRLRNAIMGGQTTASELDTLLARREYLGAMYDLRNDKRWMHDLADSPIAMDILSGSLDAMRVVAGSPIALDRIGGSSLARDIIVTRPNAIKVVGESSLALDALWSREDWERAFILSDMTFMDANMGKVATDSILSSIVLRHGATESTISYVFSAICYSPELEMFVAAGYRSYSGSQSRVLTSRDGVNWTLVSVSGAVPIQGICWGKEAGVFVAVGSNYVVSSSDGVNWVTRTPAAALNWKAVCWSPEKRLFVCVAAGTGGSQVMTSPDGLNWSAGTAALTDLTLHSVCWSKELGLFVAAGQRTAGNVIMTSPDGINWTSRTTPAGTVANVLWAPELAIFLASGTGMRMTSTDGINWTSRNVATGTGLKAVCWAPELRAFIGLGNGGNSVIHKSYDGINWTPIIETSNVASALCWSYPLRMIAIAKNTSSDYRWEIMTSRAWKEAA